MNMRTWLFIVFYFMILAIGNSQERNTLLPIVQNGKWGFINVAGKVIIEPSYDQVGSFKGSLATVKKNNLFYLIDTSGSLIFKEGYPTIQFVNDYFVAIGNEKKALADRTGKIYTGFNYSLLVDKKVNTIQLTNDSLALDIFNTKTFHLQEGGFDQVNTNENEKYVEVQKGNQVGLLDSLHAYILSPVEGDRAFIEKNTSIVKSRNGFQFYTSKSKLCGDTLYWKKYKVISSNFIEVWNHPACKFILSLSGDKQFSLTGFHIYEAIGNYLVVTSGTKKGLINAVGETTLSIEYDKIELWEDSTIRIYKENKIGLCSLDGKEIVKVQFDYIDKFNKNNLAQVNKNGLWGIINSKGKILVPWIYEEIEITSEGWKCYKNSSLDLYVVTANNLVEEVLHFNNVSFVSGQKKKFKNYAFSKSIDASSIKGLFRTGSGGLFALTSKPITYGSNSKMKCLIPKNYRNVKLLFGLYDIKRKRTIALNDYWDIQLEELETQEYARIILAGDRQGLIGRKGDLKTMYPVMKNKKTILTAITYIGSFTNGLARVNLGGTFVDGNDIKDTYRVSFSNNSLSCQGGTWGFLNGKGELQIKASYEYVSDFYNGKAIVKVKGLYGVIDTLNQFIIEPEFNEISYLFNSNNNFFKLSKNNRELGVLNDQGKVVLEANFKAIGALKENRISLQSNGRWGAYNFSGNLIIPFQYEFLSDFYEGKAWYKEKGKWNCIDSMGKLIYKSPYIDVKHFSDGYAAIRSKGKWGFINSKGNIVVPAVYSKVGYFKDGIASACLKKKWWFIDSKGKKISHQWFTKVADFDQNGLAIVTKKKKYLLFNKQTGKIIGGVKYKFIAPFSEGLARVKNKSNKIGYIDTLGKLVIPFNYFSGGDLHNGLIRVRYANGKWGYIDKFNRPKISALYQLSEDFSEGFATVNKGRNTIIIDSLGTEIATLPEKKLGSYKEGLLLINGNYYTKEGALDMGGFLTAEPFKNGIAKVGIGIKSPNYFRLINKRNSTIAVYAAFSEIENHLAVFTIYNRIGLANTEGKQILPAVYQNINYIGENIFQINSFDALGYIKQDGSWLWKPQK